MELICVAVSIVFVAATWGLVVLCDRLQGDSR
jgi:hypothetical protein